MLRELRDDGWLERFRRRACEPFDDSGQTAGGPTVPEAPALTVESNDPISLLAADGAARRPERSPECLAAATRFETVRQARSELARQSDWIDALGQFAVGVRELAPNRSDAGQCPIDDPELAGVVLAVARHRSELALEPPARLQRAGRTCWVAGIVGPAWLDEAAPDFGRKATAKQPVADYPSALAVDWVEQMCWHGIAGRADGCLRPAPDGSSESHYADLTSREPGTVTVIVSMLRAAMGCGSVGIRSYEVVRIGGRAGEWRVRNETLIEAGNHGQ